MLIGEKLWIQIRARFISRRIAWFTIRGPDPNFTWIRRVMGIGGVRDHYLKTRNRQDQVSEQVETQVGDLMDIQSRTASRVEPRLFEGINQ